MTIFAEVSLDWMVKRLEAFPTDVKDSRVEAATDYLRNRLDDHFKTVNGERYKQNKEEYERNKRRLYGSLPQLVVSGRLRDAVLKGGRVNKEGELILDFPEYGFYQIKMGRDFTAPDKKENDIWRGIWYDFMQQRAKERLSGKKR